MKKSKYWLNLETIRRLIRKDAKQNLSNLLKRQHPADIASMLADLSPEEMNSVFFHVETDEIRAEILADMEHDLAVTILDMLDISDLKKVLNAMAPDDFAALLESLPEARASELQENLSGRELDRIEDLLTYPDETAGRIMTQHVFALSDELTIREAIEEIRSADRAETVFYLYIVDKNQKLMGVVSLRRLLLEDPDNLLSSIMLSDVISVTPLIDQEEVAHLVAKYDLLAIPVVDDAGYLLGIITVDDVIDIIHEEAREDIYHMAGSNLSEDDMTSPLGMAGVRMQWLFFRFAGSVGAGAIIYYLLNHFGYQFAWIAASFPVFISLLSGIGTQSSVIVAEQLTFRSEQSNKFLSVAGREIIIGIIMGVLFSMMPVLIFGICGIVMWTVAIQLGLGLAAGMLLSTMAGTSIPYLFFRFDKDPTIVTGSIMATVLDLIGIGVFMLTVVIINS